jgi:curved DNA-binding protein CbpA
MTTTDETERNYFDDLGVPESASEDEVQRAFRKLAIKHHPDRGGSAERMSIITTAYGNLKSTQQISAYKRKLRDRRRTASTPPPASNFGGADDADWEPETFDDGDPTWTTSSFNVHEGRFEPTAASADSDETQAGVGSFDPVLVRRSKLRRLPISRGRVMWLVLWVVLLVGVFVLYSIPFFGLFTVSFMAVTVVAMLLVRRNALVDE